MRFKNFVQNFFTPTPRSSLVGSNNTEFERLSSIDATRSCEELGESLPDNHRYEPAVHFTSQRRVVAPGPSTQKCSIILQTLSSKSAHGQIRNTSATNGTITSAVAPSNENRNRAQEGQEQSCDEYFKQQDYDFQVYNPTSEELPDVADEALPFALSDVRLAMQDLMVSDGSENLASEATDSRRRSSGDCGCGLCIKACLTSTLTTRSSRDRAIALCVILGTFVCALFIITLAGMHEYNHNHEKFKGNHNLNISELEMLRRVEWPLLDVQSRKLNITYNIMAKDHTTWDKESLRKAKYKVDIHREKEHPKVKGSDIDNKILQESYKVAKDILGKKLNANSSKLEILSWKGVAVELVKEELNARFNATLESLEGHLDADVCYNESEHVHNCNETGWYSSLNGTCNNVIRKNWGSTYSPFREILKHAPKPGILMPYNTSHNFGDTFKPDPNASLILPLWGMLIMHDTVKMPDMPVKCCSSHSDSEGHQEKPCLGSASAFYATQPGKYNPVTCSPLALSPAPYPSCELDEKVTSFNLATAFIDASNIYGSTQEVTDKLRTKSNGRMRIHKLAHLTGKGFIPPDASHFNESCLEGIPKSNVTNCSLSGDPDVYQVAHLTALHTILLRQHNLIAYHLHFQNKHWGDERLFQESRRILIAQIQHITYNEFLPEIVGHHMMNMSGLKLIQERYYTSFDPVVDPSVSTVYAVAVAHFWYSMAVGNVRVLWRKGKFTHAENISISDLMFKKDFLMKHNDTLEALLRGSAMMNSNTVGLNFPKELQTLHLGKETVNLVNLIVNRGREFELARYPEWRKICGLKKLSSFLDIQDLWLPEAYSYITATYKHLEEVDLFIGMLAEKPLESARVGPTLACLLADQFLRFKMGDRFWYEGYLYFHHFTEDQLYAIRQTTLARLICDNTSPKFVQIQKWPMLTESASNPLLECADLHIPVFDFHHWKDIPKKENMVHVLLKPHVLDDIVDGDWSLEENQYENEFFSAGNTTSQNVSLFSN